MGNRKFYNQMLVDACHHHQLGVTDEVDVTTMKEYMQYAANVDESPAYLGGKENTWRRLNLDGQCVFTIYKSAVFKANQYSHLPMFCQCFTMFHYYEKHGKACV